ncbi:DUF1638 domain-containing protein [uncultured Cohaesibacter sp.]|uniref:DUF1638 domain-containing protein n=1 Tax=uncultured Cohaesibacter sp. TaxID=1002546 RepID=UPI002AABD411|nr:DUF1638 domain-containing protein [uncultured Cohaesibacter sp.]
MVAKAITCNVMEAEMRALLPEDADVEIFDISLHTRPNKLRGTLQEAVSRADGLYDPIFLGYGLCSQATVGLVAQNSHLVLFKTDDCIGVFLGSKEDQRQRAHNEPGAYFISRGWVGDGTGSLFDEYHRMKERRGEEKALKLMKKMLGHYDRIAHIIMPSAPDLEGDKAYARAMADTFGLDYVEIEGTTELIRQMVDGQTNRDVLIVPPGAPITLEMMMQEGEMVHV